MSVLELVRETLSKLPYDENSLLVGVQRELLPVLEKVRRKVNELAAIVNTEGSFGGVRVELEGIEPGTFEVQHSLGRRATGYRVEWCEFDGVPVVGDVYRVSGDADTTTTLELRTDDAITLLRVWVW
jgi:hypothetical protein